MSPQYLLSHNTNPVFQSGAICLHAAAMKGHTAVVKALLQKGAPVDTKTKVRVTTKPQHYALPWAAFIVLTGVSSNQAIINLGLCRGEHTFKLSGEYSMSLTS